MAPSSWILVVGSWLAIFACFTDSRAQDDVADITSQDLRAGKDEAKRYFLIDPPKGKTAPKTGYGLLLVLPGGAGDAGVLPFVKRINKYAVPERFLVAQLVAPKWTDQSQVVWPTAKSPVAGIKFSTEEFVDTVIDDVTSGHHIDPELIFTLSWSSGGPAAYAVSLTSRKVTGSFIAMSVFKPDLLPPLERAEGRGYFLYHSREDRVCPFRMAEQASNELAKNKTKVKLVTYEGGHGWKPGLYDEIKDGIRWLETHHAAPPAASPKGA